MWRYRGLLPVPDGPVQYPLPVGGTPLLPAPALRQTVGTPRLWIKDETRHPTASNKDRATALVIEDGLRRGVGTITTASTGNAAVATAFGAAAAGMRAVIFVSSDCQPEKLALMTQAGAWVFQVEEGYAAAVDLSRAAARTFGWLDRNTGANPFTIEAKKTVAFEVWEQLGRRLPDVMIVPVGDGPTLVALDKGFAELVSCGLATRQPRLVGVQVEHCQPLVRAWLGAPVGPAELDPTATVADGIAVVRPAIGDAVLDVVRRDGGGMVAVTDDALLSAVGMLASRAGVGAEPAGAAALAGLESAVEHGLVNRLETVVLLVTGREVKAAGAPSDRGRLALVESLDEVERALAGDG
jgi:threonine synthase